MVENFRGLILNFLAALPHVLEESKSFMQNTGNSTSDLHIASFLPALPRYNLALPFQASQNVV